MKYCVKCGNQMFDEAVLCVKCGYSPYQVSNQKKVPISEAKNTTTPQKQTSNKQTLIFLNLVNIFNFVSAFFSILSGFILGLSILFAYYDIYDSYHNYYVYWRPNPEIAVAAIVISFIAVACGITSFIFSLLNKTNKIGKLFSTLSMVVLALALFVLSIVFVVGG